MYTNTVLNNEFVNHGLKHEEDAFREYTEKTGRSVIKTGLGINPKYIGLGASPDDHGSNVHGILEMKCPHGLKDFHPTELNKLTSSQINAFYCLINENGDMCLERSHRYYYQIQMIMGVLEKKWCHFVILAYKGIHIELIKFDQLFC
ncbi:hypothetical protein JTB14_017116 [Gonioctena quinquepunctata]|nr:hypothetical protein JTB14_017116 [Gonioctena quinquepunctata]